MTSVELKDAFNSDRTALSIQHPGPKEKPLEQITS